MASGVCGGWRGCRPFKQLLSFINTTSLRGGGGGDAHNKDTSHVSQPDQQQEAPYRVFLAVGSNLGNRFENIRQALQLLCQNSTTCHLVQTSFLHETAPMYVTDQPAFLNGAVELATTLPPLALLDKIKAIEAQLGRNLQSTALRNGPRPVDLDILFYETRVEDGGDWFRRETLQTHNLTIPHPRLQERSFVLRPLLEVAGPAFVHPVLNATIGELHQQLLATTAAAPSDAESDAVRVLPLPRNRFLYWNETLVMGILNVTPDSFSDGGQFSSSNNNNNNNDDATVVEIAAQRALQMYRDQGAAVIDVGGESTRPGAQDVTVEQELQRTIPVISRLRALSPDVPISIDTRRAVVAQAAVHAGADLINDVSGGAFDPEMLSTVASLGVPMILMHMRGTSQTMQSMTDYNSSNQGGVVHEVATALAVTSRRAAAAGIPRWLQIVDPGIGFAKDLAGNVALLQNLSRIRAATQHLPILLGTSRKGFLGTLADVPVAADRDYATVASCIAALCLENENGGGACGTILRVHNPAAMVQAVKVMQAIRKGCVT